MYSVGELSIQYSRSRIHDTKFSALFVFLKKFGKSALTKGGSALRRGERGFDGNMDLNIIIIIPSLYLDI